MTTAPKLIREQLLALADRLDRSEAYRLNSDVRREAVKVAQELRALAAEPVGGEVLEALLAEMRNRSEQSSMPVGIAVVRRWTLALMNALSQPDSAEGEVLATTPCNRNCDCVGYCKAGLEGRATDDGKAMFDGEPRESWRDAVDAEQPKVEGVTVQRHVEVLLNLEAEIFGGIDKPLTERESERIKALRYGITHLQRLSAAPQPDIGVGVDVVREGTHVTVRLGDTIHYSQFHPMTQPEQPARDGVAIGRIDEGDDGAFVELYPNRDLPLNAEVFLANPPKSPGVGVDEAMIETALEAHARCFQHGNQPTDRDLIISILDVVLGGEK